jgi:hypothetical protein
MMKMDGDGYGERRREILSVFIKDSTCANFFPLLILLLPTSLPDNASATPYMYVAALLPTLLPSACHCLLLTFSLFLLDT